MYLKCAPFPNFGESWNSLLQTTEDPPEFPTDKYDE